MTQVTLGVRASNIRLRKGKCVFCNEDAHGNKEEKIKATKWKRDDMCGVGTRYTSYKQSLYPGGIVPPTVYTSEGHHCIAFSAFIKDANNKPKDNIAPLNFYLQKNGYEPNNLDNNIHLPGRKDSSDTSKYAQFKNFEKACTSRPRKPLQLHIGGHSDAFMNQGDIELLRIFNIMSTPKMCKLPDDEWQKELIKKMKKTEDKAFDRIASVTSPWICHPGPLRYNAINAEDYVKKKHGIDIKYPKLQRWR